MPLAKCSLLGLGQKVPRALSCYTRTPPTHTSPVDKGRPSKHAAHLGLLSPSSALSSFSSFFLKGTFLKVAIISLALWPAQKASDGKWSKAVG